MTSSEISVRAIAFVAAHKSQAERLGQGLAELTSDPDAFAKALSAGFAGLADPEYLEGEHRVAPGLGPTFGVRWPLTAAVDRGFRQATRAERPAGYLELADRLFDERELELRWFAFGLLDRLLPADPERSWQLLRRAARDTSDWITVDALAHPYGRGILLEGYRWAELEQLTWSPSPWERRLVGSTVATLPFVDRRLGRAEDIAVHGLGLIETLLGDAEANVQKALAWALRSLVLVDPAAVLAFVEREAKRAAAEDDGHRAWVLRDVLAKLPAERAAAIRTQLGSVRRRAGAPATSAAAQQAVTFSAQFPARAEAVAV
ncbi:MAG TPA: DNA alkylation repair protein [Candidatus Limnocylindrales bacterium]